MEGAQKASAQRSVRGRAVARSDTAQGLGLSQRAASWGREHDQHAQNIDLGSLGVRHSCAQKKIVARAIALFPRQSRATISVRILSSAQITRLQRGACANSGNSRIFSVLAVFSEPPPLPAAPAVAPEEVWGGCFGLQGQADAEHTGPAAPTHLHATLTQSNTSTRALARGTRDSLLLAPARLARTKVQQRTALVVKRRCPLPPAKNSQRLA